MNILHENKVTGKEKGRKYLVYIIRLEDNPMVGATVAVAVSVEEAAKAGRF